MIQDRPSHGVIRVSTVPLARIDVASRRRVDGRKVFVLAVSLAVLFMPAHSDAQPGVPVESVIGNDQANAAGVPFRPASRGNSTGTATLTQQILQSIRHWKEASRVVVDAVTGPATASAPAVRQTQPVLTAPVEMSVEEIIRDVWPDQLEDRAVRIAWRESRFVPTARNSICSGLFQIFWAVHKSWLASDLGITSRDQLYDARTNAEAALALYYRAGGWSPWAATA